MPARQLGAQLPAWHWEMDAGELRDIAQGAEAIGYDWLELTDHILYAYDTPDRPGRGRYTGAIVQHEVLTTAAFVAAWTSRIAVQSSILVLTQRNPILVAKQVAELDVLSGGRFRLGVGVGAHEVEMETMGVSVKQRPSRMEEAIAVLRACWSDEPITFEGRYTRMREMSMLPKPITPGGPPIYFGGRTPAAEERAGRLAAGWIGLGYEGPGGAADEVARLRGHLADNGRDADSFVIQWMTALKDDLNEVTDALRGYRDAGATHLGVSMWSHAREAQVSADEYLARLERVYREVWPALTGD